jgi:hypothetical protein
MSAPADARTGILLVRVWLEGDRTSGLRARIVRMLDVERGETLESVAGSVDEVCDVVRTWLESFSAP